MLQDAQWCLRRKAVKMLWQSKHSLELSSLIQYSFDKPCSQSVSMTATLSELSTHLSTHAA